MPETLPIRYWDDPVLSTVCSRVEDNEFDARLITFAEQLQATMQSKNGLGLAAPQVGITKQIFAMTLPQAELPEKQWPNMVVCNPTLHLSGRTLVANEGCLSLPSIFEQVSRAEHAVMQYQDCSGVTYEAHFSGLIARICQHEYDHLQGVFFFDWQDVRPEFGRRMSKQMSKRVLRDWEKQKAKLGIQA